MAALARGEPGCWVAPPPRSTRRQLPHVRVVGRCHRQVLGHRRQRAVGAGLHRQPGRSGGGDGGVGPGEPGGGAYRHRGHRRQRSTRARCWTTPPSSAGATAASGSWGRTPPPDLGDQAGEMAALAPVNLGAGRTATAVTAGGYPHVRVVGRRHRQVLGLRRQRAVGAGLHRRLWVIRRGRWRRWPPVNLGAGRTATAVTAGYIHTCALLDDGTVKCWGDGGSRAVGAGLHGRSGRPGGRDGGAAPDQLRCRSGPGVAVGGEVRRRDHRCGGRAHHLSRDGHQHRGPDPYRDHRGRPERPRLRTGGARPDRRPGPHHRLHLHARRRRPGHLCEHRVGRVCRGDHCGRLEPGRCHRHHPRRVRAGVGHRHRDRHRGRGPRPVGRGVVHQRLLARDHRQR